MAKPALTAPVACPVRPRASILAAAALGVAAMLGGIAAPALAAPKADKYQSSITSPTVATGATIFITKPSKVQAKVSEGSVLFQLKVSGIVDGASAPVTLASNTLQIDIIKNGIFYSLTFPFDITEGKVSAKIPLANSGFPSGGITPGQTFEINAVELIQFGNGKTFGVAGLTAR